MNLIKNQKGQSLVEYLVIVAIVGVGSIGVISVVGSNIDAKFAKVAESLGAKVDGAGDGRNVTANMYQRKDLKTFFKNTDAKEDSDESSPSTTPPSKK